MPEENIPILGTSGAGIESLMCQNESLKVLVGRAILFPYLCSQTQHT